MDQLNNDYVCNCDCKPAMHSYFIWCVLDTIHIYLSDFIRTWPLGFCLASGAARIQVSPVSKKVVGLTSWSVQLGSPGTAQTVGGWIRPWGQN